MEHLKTFEAACELLDYNPKEVLPVVDKMPEALAKATVAATKLFIISDAAWKTEAKEIDWNNYDQRKYYPWFDLETYPDQVGSGAGFSFYDCYYGHANSGVGSRLVFPTSEVAKYVGKTHLQLYRDLMVIE